MSIRFGIILVFVFALFYLPFSVVDINTTGTALAQATTPNAGLVGDPGGLVPCSGRDCGTCEIIVLGNRVVNFIIMIMIAGIVLIAAWAGFNILISGGNQTQYTKAKGMLKNVIIGLIIMLVGWLIVDTGLKALLMNSGQVQIVVGDESTWMPWNSVTCTSQAVLNAADPQTPDAYLWTEVPDTVAGGDGIVTGGATNVECSAAAVGGNVDCTSQIVSCTAAGGTPTVNTDIDTNYYVTCTPLDDDPVVSTGDACDEASMVNVNFLGASVRVHNSVTGDLAAINNGWIARGGNGAYSVTSVGGYVCRRIAGSNSYSQHAYGLAVDINPLQNPHLTGECRTDMPSWFVSLFTGQGWQWGCSWTSSKDAMHYSKNGG